MNKQKGAINLLILLGVTIIVAAIPVATKLVQERQEIRKMASIDAPCKVCERGECVRTASPPNCSHSFNECADDSNCPQPTQPPSQPTATPKPEPTQPPRPTSPPIDHECFTPDDCQGQNRCNLDCRGWPRKCYWTPCPTSTPKPTNTPILTSTPTSTPVNHECFTPDDCQGPNRCNLSCHGWPRKCSWTICPIATPTSISTPTPTVLVMPGPVLSPTPMPVIGVDLVPPGAELPPGAIGWTMLAGPPGEEPVVPIYPTETHSGIEWAFLDVPKAMGVFFGWPLLGLVPSAISATSTAAYSYGTAALATAPAWVPAAMEVGGTALTLGGTGYTAYQCSQGNTDACIAGMVGGQMWTEQQTIQSWAREAVAREAAVNETYWEDQYRIAVKAIRSTNTVVQEFPEEEWWEYLMEHNYDVFRSPAGIYEQSEAYKSGRILISPEIKAKDKLDALAHEYLSHHLASESRDFALPTAREVFSEEYLGYSFGAQSPYASQQQRNYAQGVMEGVDAYLFQRELPLAERLYRASFTLGVSGKYRKELFYGRPLQFLTRVSESTIPLERSLVPLNQ